MSDLSKWSDAELWQALADTGEVMSNLGKYQKYLAIGEVLPKDHASRVELVISNIREASVLRQRYDEYLGELERRYKGK